MKLLGRGYTPRVSGRPSREVVDIESTTRLQIDLKRRGVVYHPDVKSGGSIDYGASLASAQVNGTSIFLPSPATGRVVEVSDNFVAIEGQSAPGDSPPFEPLKSEYATGEQVRDRIAQGGLWPAFWSSVTDGMPVIDGSEVPASCIVHFVTVEPFHARGRVILTRDWDDIMAGIRFLPKLIEDYGKVEVILTHVHDPVAKKMYQELAGHAWTRLHPVPLRYPVGDPKLIASALRRDDGNLNAESVIWSIDAQGIAQLGRLLAKGESPQRRLVTLGGPGAVDPKHYSVPIGTPLSDLPAEELQSDKNLVLRGGILRGDEIDASMSAVQFDDDGFFLLPEAIDRQALSFVRPGFDRVSIFPAFAGSLLSRDDSHINASLRGETRPCISCGACERICPVGLLPQVLHRYLHRELPDEAIKLGLETCIDCNLCTFVCPSKIGLQEQFASARIQIAEERREIAAANATKAVEE